MYLVKYILRILLLNRQQKDRKNGVIIRYNTRNFYDLMKINFIKEFNKIHSNNITVINLP